MGAGSSEAFIPFSYVEELLREVERIGLSPSEAAGLLREAARQGLISGVSGQGLRDRGLRSEEQQSGRSVRRGGEQGIDRPVKVAEAILSILSGRSCEAENLEALTEYLKNILSRRGEGEVAIEPQVLEKARRLLVRALMPSVKDLLVPKWVFDSLERELRAAQERVRYRELEVERLRYIFKSRGAEPSTIRLYQVSGLLEEEPSGISGMTAKIVCPLCRELNNVYLPPREEVEKALNTIGLYRLHCASCHRAVDLEPARILRVIEEQERVGLHRVGGG